MERFCILCLKRVPGNFHHNEDECNDNDKTGLETGKESCPQRFFELLEKYLFEGSESESLKWKSLVKLLINSGVKSGGGRLSSCRDCLTVIESFCDLFHKMKEIEQLLQWKLRTIKIISEAADMVPERLAAVKGVLQLLAADSNNNKEKMEDNIGVGNGADLFSSLIQLKKCIIKKCSQKLQILDSNGDHQQQVPFKAEVGVIFYDNRTSEEEINTVVEENVEAFEEAEAFHPIITSAQGGYLPDPVPKINMITTKNPSSSSSLTVASASIKIEDKHQEQNVKDDILLTSFQLRASPLPPPPAMSTPLQPFSNHHHQVANEEDYSSTFDSAFHQDRVDFIDDQELAYLNWNLFKCNHCDKCFKHEQSLRLHKSALHCGLQWKCGYCPTTFNYKCGAKSHIITNHIQSNNGIPLPLKVWRVKRGISTSPTPEENHPSEKAEKSVLTTGTENIPPPQRQMPVQKQNLYGNNFFTSSRGIFKCAHCPKQFHKLQSLKLHITWRHSTKLKRYVCKVCLKRFSTWQTLLTHTRSAHLGMRYKCKFCSRLYTQPGTLQQHLKFTCDRRLLLIQQQQQRPNDKGVQQNDMDLLPNGADPERKTGLEKQPFIMANDINLDRTSNNNKEALKIQEDPLDMNTASQQTFSAEEEETSEQFLSRLLNLEDNAHPHHLNVFNGSNSNSSTFGRSTRRFACQVCRKPFKFRSSVSRHMNAVHRGLKWKCLHCPRTFDYKCNAQSHMENIHNDSNGIPLFLPVNERPLDRDQEQSQGQYRVQAQDQLENQDKTKRIAPTPTTTKTSPEKCRLCNETFNSSANNNSLGLGMHFCWNRCLSSWKKSNYECQLCLTKFSTVTELLGHKESVHFGKR